MDTAGLDTPTFPDRFTVTASTFVAQSPDRVWTELLHPGARWMLGANIDTDFTPGSPMKFDGNFFGRTFRDHGHMIACERPHLLYFTHFSPLSDMDDVPDNYHHIRITLDAEAEGTRVTVEQSNIASPQRAARAQEQWKLALSSIAHSEGSHSDGSHDDSNQHSHTH